MTWWNAQAPSSTQLERIFKESTALANAFSILLLLEQKGLVHAGKRMPTQ